VHCALCIALFSFALPQLSAHAADEKSLDAEVERNLVNINLSELEGFFAGLEDNAGFGQSARALIQGIIRGEQKFSIDTVYRALLGSLRRNFLQIIPALVTIIIIGILYSVSTGLSSGFVRESTNDVIYYVCYGAVIVLVFFLLNSVIVSVRNTVAGLDRLVGIIFPILLTLITALGGAGSASVYQPMMAIFSTTIIRLINFFIMPLFFATIIFTVVGNLSQNVRLDKLTKTTKSIAEWTLGIVFGLFFTFITAQGIVGAAYDTISIRSAKFALSSYVPILGGYLSEGFDLVLASCILIKNAVGLTGLIILFLTVLTPLIKVLVLIFGLRIASSILEPLGEKRISELLHALSKNLTLLVTIILGLAFIIFTVIMLIIYTANLGVI
jgi:stage III sporulation protein AE